MHCAVPYGSCFIFDGVAGWITRRRQSYSEGHSVQGLRWYGGGLVLFKTGPNLILVRLLVERPVQSRRGFVGNTLTHSI